MFISKLQFSLLRLNSVLKKKDYYIRKRQKSISQPYNGNIYNTTKDICMSRPVGLAIQIIMSYVENNATLVKGGPNASF